MSIGQMTGLFSGIDIMFVASSEMSVPASKIVYAGYCTVE